jgi:hypothetical protein
MRTASAFTCLAAGRAKQGDYAEADALIQRALRIEENAGGPDSLLHAVTLIEYSKVLRHNGQKRHATEMEKEAQALFGRSRKASCPILKIRPHDKREAARFGRFGVVPPVLSHTDHIGFVGPDRAVLAIPSVQI